MDDERAYFQLGLSLARDGASASIMDDERAYFQLGLSLARDGASAAYG